jgi:SulP family sulfate permease
MKKTQHRSGESTMDLREQRAQTVRNYRWKEFRSDLLAGLTVAAVALPQGMAYALVAGVDPRYGVYTAIVMTALGSVFNSSAHLINGPTNAISLVAFSALAAVAPATREDAHEAIFLLALLVGALQVGIFFFKLGDLTRYVSESVILGFMLGAGILIALNQLPALLGLQSVGERHLHLLLRLWLTLSQGGPVQLSAAVLGVGAALLALLFRSLGDRLRVPLPDLLLALVFASLGGWAIGWQEEWPAFPASLPHFHIPHLDLDRVRRLGGSALALAVLGLLEAIAIAKSIAARTRQPLDYNWQCLAEGLANLGGGLFQCIPGSGSLTRSAINYQAGAVSRLSGIFSAGAVALAVLLFADLAQFVPRPALAGLLLVTAWRLVDRSRIVYCLRATRFDAGVALATAGAAIFVSIEFSVLIGVFLSFLLFVPRASRLRATELVVSPERVVRERRPDDPRCTRMIVISLEGDLFFGAAPELDQVLAHLSSRAEEGIRIIVLRLKRTRNADMVCLERLQHFLQEMQRRKVVVLLCGVREDFANALERLGFHDWLPREYVFFEGIAGSIWNAETSSPEGPQDLRTEGRNGERHALSSTLEAVRIAYEILDDDLCPHCPLRQKSDKEGGEWYYMI